MAEEREPRHVLVINDTPEILAIFRQVLEEEGYRVSLDRFSGELGSLLDLVKREAPDLIVLDYLVRGEQSGWQFLQMLKMDRATRGVPVVICTAAARQVDEIRTHLDAMGVRVLLKPFDIDHLLEVIARTWRAQGPA